MTTYTFGPFLAYNRSTQQLAPGATGSFYAWDDPACSVKLLVTYNSAAVTDVVAGLDGLIGEVTIEDHVLVRFKSGTAPAIPLTAHNHGPSHAPDGDDPIPGGGGAGYTLPKDGLTDVVAGVNGLQALYDSGVRAISLDGDGTYLFNSAWFLDSTDQDDQFVINGNGATILLGASLPTSDWSQDPTVQWAIFPNTNRGALSGGVVTVSDANRSTGPSNGGVQSRLVVENVTVESGGADRGLTFDNRCRSTYRQVVNRAWCINTWFSYTDGHTYEDCYQRNTVLGGAFVYQTAQGDGLEIRSPKADSNATFAILKTCRGAVISGAVTARIEMDECSSINVKGAHLEGQQSDQSVLVISNSNVEVDGSTIYENATTPAITITDGSSESDSAVTLKGCTGVAFYSGGQPTYADFVQIVSVGENTTLEFERFRSTMASTQMSGKHPDTRMPSISGPAAVQAALDSDAGRIARATGSWKLARVESGAWECHAIGERRNPRSTSAPAAPSIAQITTSSGVGTGGGLPQTLHEYAVAVRDAQGRWSAASAAVQATPNANGATRILLNLPERGTRAVLVRKAGAGVLTAPDAYIELEVGTSRPYVMDTGDKCMGKMWSIASVPVLGTVAAANDTADGLALGAGELYVPVGGASSGRLMYQGTDSGEVMLSSTDQIVQGGIRVIRWDDVGTQWLTAGIPNNTATPAWVQVTFWLSQWDENATPPPSTHLTVGDIWFRNPDAAPL